MAGLKKEETNENVNNQYKNGPSATDLVKAAEKKLGVNTNHCKYMQLIIILILVIFIVIFSLVYITEDKLIVKVKCLSMRYIF